jgi:hypothetical protein
MKKNPIEDTAEVHVMQLPVVVVFVTFIVLAMVSRMDSVVRCINIVPIRSVLWYGALADMGCFFTKEQSIVATITQKM